MTTTRTIILAVAIALAGLFVGWGFARGRATNRYVEVKGVAERPVRADLAIWPLRLVSANDDLARAHAKLDSDVVRVRRFLASQGIDTASIVLQDFGVTDARSTGETSAARYVIRQTLVVRSTKPEQVAQASQHVGELVAAGVVLSSGQEYQGGGPTFVFTKLNDLKPPMIAEATTRAREAADQFARNAQTSVGDMLQANQGVFEILPRDQASGITEESQIEKRVRVVSTVQYQLK